MDGKRAIQTFFPMVQMRPKILFVLSVSPRDGPISRFNQSHGIIYFF